MFNFNTSLDSLALPGMISSSARSSMQSNLSSEPSKAELPPPTAGDWLWKPWYAKIWWAAIPLYWAIATASLKIPALTSIFETALAGYLNVLFFPMTALLVLGFGFVRAWLEAWGADEGPPLTEKEIGELEENQMLHEDWLKRRPGQPDPAFDIYDPRSGGLYVGNPLSPQYPGRR